jgi:hypothetical protein
LNLLDAADRIERGVASADERPETESTVGIGAPSMSVDDGRVASSS